jgi:hypothetical protein
VIVGHRGVYLGGRQVKGFNQLLDGCALAVIGIYDVMYRQAPSGDARLATDHAGCFYNVLNCQYGSLRH